MSFGPYSGDGPSKAVTVEGLFGRKGRSRIAVIVLNDSEEGAIFVRDITVYGVTTGEGTPLMFGEGDVRLEPRQRLVKSLEVEDEDVEEFRENGFAARVTLSTGETLEARDKLVDDFLNFNLTSRNEGDLH